MSIIRKTALVVMGFVLAVFMLSATTASAGPGTVMTDSAKSVVVPGPEAAAAPQVGIMAGNSSCAVLTSDGGARVDVCKTWHLRPEGVCCFGAWSGQRLLGQTFAQVSYDDGKVVERGVTRGRSSSG